MPDFELREIDRFPARSDDGSRETTIILLQYMISTAHRGDPDAVTPGMKHAETIDGVPCERIDDDTFQISTTGQIVRRIKVPRET